MGDRRSSVWAAGLAFAALVLQSCVKAPPRPGWAEPGLAVVGRIVRVEDAEIWIGDGPGRGHVFWLETDPPHETVIFGSRADCPPAEPSADRYLVMLGHARYGYSGAKIDKSNAPWLYAVACTRIDPAMSSFPAWRPQP